jgi:hypothetical protein
MFYVYVKFLTNVYEHEKYYSVSVLTLTVIRPESKPVVPSLDLFTIRSNTKVAISLVPFYHFAKTTSNKIYPSKLR